MLLRLSTSGSLRQLAGLKLDVHEVMRIPYLLLVLEVVDNLHDQQHMRASHDFFGTTQLIRPVMPKIL